MNRDQLLQLLKDLEAPPEPAWWLPGPGHLVLLALAALAIILVLLYRQRRRARYRAGLAADELERIAGAHREHGDDLKLARELSAWLRRVCLVAFPGSKAAGLTGDSWLAFLDRQQGGDRFSRGVGQLFGGDVYRRNAAVDVAALLALCRDWLRDIEPALRGRGPP